MNNNFKKSTYLIHTQQAMKLLFSEYKSDYSNYIFPYAIWAIPEQNESPAQIFNRGFLPGNRDMSRYYLCRQIRIKLNNFRISSENRRILRKCDGIEYKLLNRDQFEYSNQWREFCKTYADIKFGKDVMTHSRLDSLFQAKILTHVLIFIDSENNKEIGLVTLYLEEKSLAYYYYAFYALNYYHRNLGMYMMTSAVNYFKQEHFDFIFLGTCYSNNALYKTQFEGAEFFNGFQWSGNLKELKYMVKRDQSSVSKHLLETEEFIQLFYDNNFTKIMDGDK